MHARDLVQLAVLVSEHGALLVEHDERIALDDLESYWTQSRARLNRWGQDLKVLSEGSWRGTSIDRPDARALVEEILAAEVLTRVWTAVMFAYDRRHGFDDALPIAHGIYVGHLESRNRCLKLLVARHDLSTEEAAQLDRTRRAAERWSDLLVAPLTELDDVARFASDPARATRLARQLSGEVHDASRRALEVAFAHAAAVFLKSESPNADLNAQVASAVLACFSADAFDTTGLLRSWFVARLTRTASDTQGLVEDLFACDEPETAPAGEFLRREGGRVARFGGPFRSR